MRFGVLKGCQWPAPKHDSSDLTNEATSSAGACKAVSPSRRDSLAGRSAEKVPEREREKEWMVVVPQTDGNL